MSLIDEHVVMQITRNNLLPMLFTAHDLVYAVLAVCQASIEEEKFSMKKNLNTKRKNIISKSLI